MMTTIIFKIPDDLNGARFLWKRMPTELKGTTEIAGLWDIGKVRNVRTYVSRAWMVPMESMDLHQHLYIYCVLYCVTTILCHTV